MGQLIAKAVVPLIFKGAGTKAITAVGTGLNIAGTAALSSAATKSAMKAAAPQPPAVPTQISKPPTVIATEAEPRTYGTDSRQMDLLSTIIAGRERKNKLG